MKKNIPLLLLLSAICISSVHAANEEDETDETCKRFESIVDLSDIKPNFKNITLMREIRVFYNGEGKGVRCNILFFDAMKGAKPNLASIVFNFQVYPSEGASALYEKDKKGIQELGNLGLTVTSLRPDNSFVKDGYVVTVGNETSIRLLTERDNYLWFQSWKNLDPTTQVDLAKIVASKFGK